METILIATDFSNASRNASLYGVELAKAIKAKILLFNAYEVPKPVASTFNITVSRYALMMQTDKRLLAEANFLDPNREKIEIICDEGPAQKAIIDIANEKKVDIVIIGMKGSGNNFKRIFGSTATALAKSTNIPLIVVPEDAKFKSPDIVVFADDKKADYENMPEKLKAITHLCFSKLYMINVDENAEPPVSLDNALPSEKNLNTTILDLPVKTDIRHTLNEFVKKSHADMLIMTPHQHEKIDLFFKKSETKKMIFHTHIPLLILPEQK